MYRRSPAPFNPPINIGFLPESPHKGMAARYFDPNYEQLLTFVYNPDAPGLYKWLYDGGAAFSRYDGTVDVVPENLGGYQGLPTAQVSIMAPLNGEYRVEFSCWGYNDDPANELYIIVCPFNQADPPNDDNGATFSLSPYQMVQFSSMAPNLEVGGGDSVDLRVFVLGGPVTLGGFKMELLPIRVGA